MFLRYSVGDGKELQVLLLRDSEKSILQIASVSLAWILKQQYPLTAALHLKQQNLGHSWQTDFMFKAGDTKMMLSVKKNQFWVKRLLWKRVLML